MLSTLSKLWDHQHWGIGLVRKPVHLFSDPAFVPEITWFEDPAFSADPFLVCHDGKMAVLYEEFDYRSHRGRISAVELHESGFGQIHRNIIQDEFHFSYPMCVHYGGELFCIPEHSQSGHLSAYRCVRFPDQWVLDRVVLVSVPVVDPTIFFNEDLWWMMCTRLDQKPNSRLVLYFGPTPLGPWTEHPENPVKSSLLGSRPAGPVFHYDGVLYRPSQDCSAAYGGAIVIQRIVKLNPKEYAEVSVRRIEPLLNTPYKRGIHHLSGIGGLSLIDGCRSVFDLHEAAHVLKHWKKKLLRC